jgi:hypothetical protein
MAGASNRSMRSSGGSRRRLGRVYARQLVYLHRVNGDLAAAYLLAQELQDPGLKQALLVEMRRWAEAAALQQSDPCPLPIPWPHRAATLAGASAIEQLGLTAAYQRLAGEREALSRTIQRVGRDGSDGTRRPFAAMAVRGSASAEWVCRTRTAATGRYDPGRAFDLLRLAPSIPGCVAAARVAGGKTLDVDWIESLPTRGSTDEQRVVERVESALKVIRLLHRLGRRDEALAAALLVEEYSRGQADGNSSNSPRNQCFERLAQPT